MPEKPQWEEFGSSEALLKDIQERADDLEKAVIPCGPTQYLMDRGQVQSIQRDVGMILYFCNGERFILCRKDAELALNDGIFTRMRIKVELFPDRPL